MALRRSLFLLARLAFGGQHFVDHAGNRGIFAAVHRRPSHPFAIDDNRGHAINAVILRHLGHGIQLHTDRETVLGRLEFTQVNTLLLHPIKQGLFTTQLDAFALNRTENRQGILAFQTHGLQR